MGRRELRREAGLLMVAVMVFVSFIFALAAGLSMIAVAGLRASSESQLRMRTVYLADSGAQAGVFLVRQSGGALGETSFVETIEGETATVQISPLSVTLYRVTSTGAIQDEEVQIDVYLTLAGNFRPNGAFDLTVGDGVEVRADEIFVEVLGSGAISGLDHSPAESPLVDQANASHALGVHPLPGDVDFAPTVGNAATLEGFPEATTNNGTDHSAILEALTAEAQANADVFIDGSTVLGPSSTGLYGTPEDPRLVYATLGRDSSIVMQGNFTGHGTLVINAERSESDDSTTLLMRGDVSWHGFILIYYRDRVRVRDGEALIEMTGNSRIVGGLSMFANGDRFRIDDPTLLRVGGNARLLYSHELVSTARGIAEVTAGSERTARIIAYIAR